MFIGKWYLHLSNLINSTHNKLLLKKSSQEQKTLSFFHTPVFLGFPCGSVGKESACNAGDLGLIAGLGRSPGKGKDYPL